MAVVHLALNSMHFITAKNSLFLLFVLCSLTVVGQHKKKIEGAKGEWVVSNDITPIQARENAINQAKVEALRQAGVPELISESNLMYHSEKPEKMKELFESLTTVAISGEVSEFTIVKEDKKLNNAGNIICEVWINATVLIHKTAKDQGFDFDVKGIHESYSSPDNLAFEITPWKDGYMTVFILGEKESLQLFPNSSEHSKKLTAQHVYAFPQSKSLDYEISTEGAVEINYLALLYTKQEVPFMSEPTATNILKFIAGIDPAEKRLKTYSLLIKK